MSIYRGLLAAVTSLLILTAALPAHAETRVVKDKRGDAPVIVDVTRAKLTNGTNAFDIVVKFRNLKARGLALNVSLDSYDVADWRHYTLSVFKKKKRVRTSLLVSDESGYAVAQCRRIKAEWAPGRGGRIEVRAPRTCFDLSSSVAFSALAVVEGDIGDRTRTVVVAQD